MAPAQHPGMRYLLTTLGLVTAALGSVVASARAQQCPQRACIETYLVSVHVGTVLRLGVQGSTTLLARARPETLADGGPSSMGPTALVRSNGAWRLEVSAAQEAWTPMDSAARPDKPAADLSVSTSSSEGFQSVGTAPAAVARGGPTDGAALPLYYRAEFTPTSDTPGTYSLTVRLTLVGA